VKHPTDVKGLVRTRKGSKLDRGRGRSGDSRGNSGFGKKRKKSAMNNTSQAGVKAGGRKTQSTVKKRGKRECER